MEHPVLLGLYTNSWRAGDTYEVCVAMANFDENYHAVGKYTELVI